MDEFGDAVVRVDERGLAWLGESKGALSRAVADSAQVVDFVEVSCATLAGCGVLFVDEVASPLVGSRVLERAGYAVDVLLPETSFNAGSMESDLGVAR